VGTWVVPADLLAGSRFVVSPLTETVAALILLTTPEPLGVPWQRAFRGLHREAYLEMLAADETRSVIENYLWRPWRGQAPGWIADFLCLPPRSGTAIKEDTVFEGELDQLSAWDDDRIRAAIGEFTGGPLPAGLARAGLRDAVAGILRWVWTTTLVSEWPRRRRVLEADIVSRTSRLSSLGWAGVLGTLGPNTRWLGDGRLQINAYDRPSRDLSAARELSFVPVHGYRGWSALELPHWFAVVYPVTGALAPVASAARPGLGRLIGGNRARVLALLDEPHSTTQLAAITGLPMGAVGNHLRVLLDAGAVLRRRAGREVLYWRTSLGDSLVAAGFRAP
jgi:DNA-binding transcriptional ArsR family regulator